MTREELKNYRKNIELLFIYKCQLKEMRTTDSGLDNSVIMDYTKGFARPQSVVGFDYERYKRLLEKCLEKERAVKEVENFIHSIEDDDMARYCFEEHYLKGVTWNEIAIKQKWISGESYPRKIICGSYLKKHKIA